MISSVLELADIELLLSTLRFFATEIVEEVLDALILSPPKTDSELTTIVSVKFDVVNFWPSVSLAKACISLLFVTTAVVDPMQFN